MSQPRRLQETNGASWFLGALVLILFMHLRRHVAGAKAEEWWENPWKPPNFPWFVKLCFSPMKMTTIKPSILEQHVLGPDGDWSGHCGKLLSAKVGKQWETWTGRETINKLLRKWGHVKMHSSGTLFFTEQQTCMSYGRFWQRFWSRIKAISNPKSFTHVSWSCWLICIYTAMSPCVPKKGWWMNVDSRKSGIRKVLTHPHLQIYPDQRSGS